MPTRIHIHKLSNINPENRTADCKNCGQVHIRRKNGTGWRCGVGNRVGSRPAMGYKTGHCPICKSYTDKLVYDHQHDKPIELRGWICTRCNIGLGYFKDNVTSLENAISYLNSFSPQPI